jgi:metallo-beta-lactamase class B
MPGRSGRISMRRAGLFLPASSFVAVAVVVAGCIVACLIAVPPAGGAPLRDLPFLQPDRPIDCPSCEEWNRGQKPFRVFGNTYYVGVAGLSSILIASGDDLILIDGGLPQSAPRIDENVRALGFKTDRIGLILNSHAHFDHAGGIAALQRASGAEVAASAAGAKALERGEPLEEDPQYGLPRESKAFPPVKPVRAIADGVTLRVGALAVTAHLTPGHTPGSTTWTWRSCEGERCLDIVYADSLTAVSAPGFEFTARAGLVELFRASIATIRGLPCDVLLSVHPDFSGLKEKLLRRREGTAPDPFIDAGACRAYADAGAAGLAKRIAEEKDAAK